MDKCTNCSKGLSLCCMQPLRTSDCSREGSNHSTLSLSTQLLCSSVTLHVPAVLSLHPCNSQISQILAKEPVIHRGTAPNQHNCLSRCQDACYNCEDVSRHGGDADSSWSSFGPEGGAAPPSRCSWSPGTCCCTPHRFASLQHSVYTYDRQSYASLPVIRTAARHQKAMAPPCLLQVNAVQPCDACNLVRVPAIATVQACSYNVDAYAYVTRGPCVCLLSNTPHV